MKHADFQPGQNHVIHEWEYADAAEREGDTGFVTADLFKIALQLDNHSLWILVATTPTWVAIGDADAITSAELTTALSALTLDNVTNNGADIASAGTLDLDAATGDALEVTGTTTVTAITLAEGRERKVTFAAAVLLTYSASLLLPTGADITTAAGDVVTFRGEASGVVRCIGFLRADGSALAGSGSGTVTHTGGALTSNAVLLGAGGSDSKAIVSLGTAGQVLTSAGAGSPPAFQDPAAAATLDPPELGSSGVAPFPTIADDNALYTDECNATTGWTLTGGGNATITSDGAKITLGTGTGINRGAYKDITQVPASNDFIVYFRAQAGYGAGQYTYILLTNGSSTEKLGIYFGYNWATTSVVQGTISVLVNASSPNATLITGYDYSVATDYAVQVDRNRGVINFFMRDNTSGKWDFKNSISYFAGVLDSTRAIINLGNGTATSFSLHYFLTARPNIVAIGDSITAGHNLFDPDPSVYGGIDEDNSTIWKHAKIYQSLRNNLIVNKGIGSETSGALLTRIAEATAHSPRVVILMASNNDRGTYTQTQRTDNIQDSIDAIVAASAEPILLNAMYSNSGDANQTAHNLYMRDWWDNYMPTLTDVDVLINTVFPAMDGNGDLAAANSQSDGIHPNETGYQLIGEWIAELESGVAVPGTLTYADGGTPVLTASSALIAFTSIDPALILNAAGTYLIRARVNLEYNAATFAANQTVTLKLRRTNNTAADIANSSTVVKLRIVTTITDLIGVITLPEIVYDTANTNDRIELWAILSALPGAGSVIAREASLIAQRIG